MKQLLAVLAGMAFATAAVADAPEIRITASDLAAAPSAQYTGQRVRVSGTVVAFGRGDSIVLDGGVQVHGIDSHAEKIKRGQLLTVKCTGAGALVLNECSINQVALW